MVIPLYFVALLRLAMPVGVWRHICSRIIDGVATGWVAINNWNMRITKNIQWDVRGTDSDKLKTDEWYLILSNHQSWVDILILQKIFHRKIPLLKFFIKKELIWVPFLGFAWWALDFPFMKRYSNAFLEKHPHLKGKDIETTRKACEKFKTIPISVMNFVEGTRFTIEKHQRQQSPFNYLLRPKAGGTAMVLDSMGERLRRILNVTIAYPEGEKSFWAFLCGRIREIRVRVECLPIGKELLGDYFDDVEFREQFQEWLTALWADKDRQLEDLLNTPQTASESS
jgi:1-acyl-sn-glycerol-3-phosphate acyltransferase